MSFEKQIISKNRYLSIFSRQMEAVVFNIVTIFRKPRILAGFAGAYSVAFRPIELDPNFSMDYNL